MEIATVVYSDKRELMEIVTVTYSDRNNICR